MRIHRTFWQKFLYMAVYQCRRCNQIHYRPRRFMFYFADVNRCPLCGTGKLTRLAARDGIDRVHWNLFRLVHPVLKTPLYHCRFCRIQFYDIPREKAHESHAV